MGLTLPGDDINGGATRRSEVRACLEAALGPGYRIEREVRPAGACRRLVAQDLVKGGEVLVKIFPIDLAIAVDAERFEHRLLESSARLDHPGAVRSLAGGMAGPYLYYVRPFIRGTTLRARLEKQGPIPLLEAVRLLRMVLEVLDRAHSGGVLHGDLKPENVLLFSEGAAVVEFGVVPALVESAREGRSNWVGLALAERRYLSPERLEGSGLPSVADDIYAAGTVACEMLAGQLPDPTSGAEPHAWRHSIPSRLADIVLRCLQRDPRNRWQQPGEMLRALDRTLSG